MSIKSYYERKRKLALHKKAKTLAIIGIITTLVGLLGIGDYPVYQAIEMEMPPIFVAIATIGGIIIYYTVIRYGRYLDISEEEN